MNVSRDTFTSIHLIKKTIFSRLSIYLIDMNNPRITLDQWSALVAVVEAGGYAQASARLHRTQSTVTYTIKQLEERLGVRVFERQGRRAVLTPAGQVLYRRGKSLLEDAARIERAASGLARGWEPEIRLAVDIVFPTWLLLQCFAEFSREQPETRMELIESVLGGTEEALVEGRVDLAIGGTVPGGFLGDPIMQVRFVCAAAPAHPLHRLGRTINLDDLRRHRHLVVRDSGALRSRSGARGALVRPRWFRPVSAPRRWCRAWRWSRGTPGGPHPPGLGRRCGPCRAG